MSNNKTFFTPPPKVSHVKMTIKMVEYFSTKTNFLKFTCLEDIHVYRYTGMYRYIHIFSYQFFSLNKLPKFQLKVSIKK